MVVSAASLESAPAPCPHRILDDLGSAFAMAALGGSVYYGIKGMRNSPRGARLRGGMTNIILRTPTLGGNFAIWGGLFSTFDCAFANARGKEDPWNAIASGALTGGLLAARQGAKAIGRNALVGGLLLAGIEGLMLMLNKVNQPAPPQVPLMPGLSAPLSAPVASVGGMNFNTSGMGLVSPQSNYASFRADEEFGVDDFSFDEKPMGFEE